jgi:hypothetical protein
MAQQGKATITLLFEDGSIREHGDIVFSCNQAGFKTLLEFVVVESRKHITAPEKQPDLFYSAHAAEAAAFGDGCPDCSGSDIEVA